MWEVFTGGETPYAHMKNPQVVDEVARGYRLLRPKDCSRSIYAIMRSCWSHVSLSTAFHGGDSLFLVRARLSKNASPHSDRCSKQPDLFFLARMLINDLRSEQSDQIWRESKTIGITADSTER